MARASFSNRPLSRRRAARSSPMRSAKRSTGIASDSDGIGWVIVLPASSAGR
jgi:hypothetical protein